MVLFKNTLAMTSQFLMINEIVAFELEKKKKDKREHFKNLKRIGNDIGFKIAISISDTVSMAKSDLEAAKSLCSILWPALFYKKADGLKSNAQIKSKTSIFDIRSVAFIFIIKSFLSR
ncbi:hypothetical protein MHBO_000279 [Bonamia ostreae]|uniref:Uncharacterized protein n=1 Tax=Bonamia ostreae TaxID=126728 RepID=A0ABV2AGC2_9EUKA